MLGRVTVVGCGLIGGSIVQSLRKGRRSSGIFAVDRQQVLSVARPHLDAAAEPGTAQAEELVRGSDLVILALPVFAIIQNLDWVLGAIGEDAVVTDTGSVKKAILESARSHPRAGRFVAGHPMAGRETGGFESGHRRSVRGVPVVSGARDRPRRASPRQGCGGSAWSRSPKRSAPNRSRSMPRRTTARWPTFRTRPSSSPARFIASRREPACSGRRGQDFAI